MSSSYGSDLVLSFQPSNRFGYWLLGGAACIPIAYLLLRSKPATAQDSTDFDSFLVKQRPPQALQPTKPATSFDDFLLVKAASATCFESFLKAAPGGAQETGAADNVVQAATVQAHHVRVAVMFGTEYGFAKEIAEKLSLKLRQTDEYWPALINVADYPEGYDFSQEQAVLMVCSTQGDGVPPTEARDFCEWLMERKAGDLSHLKYSVCALGDRSYEHFCRCGKLLDAAFSAQGAHPLVPRHDVDREDWGTIDRWLEAVCAGLPALQLKSIGETGGGQVTVEQKKAAPKRWSKSRPYYGTIVAVQGLCTIRSADDKDTFRVELDLGDSGLAYVPGDALGIYPTNCPEGVRELLAAANLDGNCLVATPGWHYEEEAAVLQALPAGQMPLMAALAKCYDLRSPKPDIFRLLLESLPESTRQQAADIRAGMLASESGHGTASGHVIQLSADARGPAQAAVAATNGLTTTTQPRPPSSPGKLHKPVSQALQLLELQADGTKQEAYLTPRHVVDVLLDFPSCKLSLQQLLGALRPLLPRLYSISSSPLEDPTRVQATIAAVKYTTLGKDRIGVCSTCLSERMQVGQRVPIYMSKNPDFRLPADPSTPIIMVGPGTGLAPFRAFIYQRLLQQQPGPMVLYFGCRRKDQDYLYGDQLEAWAAEGEIQLYTAFSRQQAAKVYVQQRLRESGDLVWELLQRGGHFYVCGDANSMAGSVQAALLDIIEARQQQGRDAAEAYLEQLSNTERYQRDVWFA